MTAAHLVIRPAGADGGGLSDVGGVVEVAVWLAEDGEVRSRQPVHR